MPSQVAFDEQFGTTKNVQLPLSEPEGKKVSQLWDILWETTEENRKDGANFAKLHTRKISEVVDLLSRKHKVIVVLLGQAHVNSKRGKTHSFKCAWPQLQKGLTQASTKQYAIIETTDPTKHTTKDHECKAKGSLRTSSLSSLAWFPCTTPHLLSTCSIEGPAKQSEQLCQHTFIHFLYQQISTRHSKASPTKVLALIKACKTWQWTAQRRLQPSDSMLTCCKRLAYHLNSLDHFVLSSDSSRHEWVNMGQGQHPGSLQYSQLCG